MNTIKLEKEIISSVQTLSGQQKVEVLDYIKNIEPSYITKGYRRKAMKQIREALQMM